MNEEIDIATINDLEKLKALIYDQIRVAGRVERNIAVMEKRLAELENQPPITTDPAAVTAAQAKVESGL